MLDAKRKKPDIRARMKSRREAVDLDRIDIVRSGPLSPELRLPLVYQPVQEGVDLSEWARENRELLDRQLLEHGALLFRGFGVTSVPAFERFAEVVVGDLFGQYGDLPQGEGQKSYESTPYPPEKSILFHNEASHTPSWPMKQMFFCVTAARERGETPIVDCREVYRRLRPELRDEFAAKGLRYVRTFTPGLDVSWQDFFKTRDRSEVEAHCRANGRDLEWLDDGGLRTSEQAPAVARHPKTGEDLFFNQIQVHHVAFLDPDLRRSMSEVFGEERLPRNVTFGDGSPIPDEVALEVFHLYQELAVEFPWREGDVLLLDNMLAAHARNPYVGPRKIAVAMGEMFERKTL